MNANEREWNGGPPLFDAWYRMRLFAGRGLCLVLISVHSRPFAVEILYPGIRGRCWLAKPLPGLIVQRKGWLTTMNVETLIGLARDQGASDLHLEPGLPAA